jgi:tetratricopeptide (TPR) repeat protein
MERQLNLILKTDPHNQSARYYRILCRSRMNIEPSLFTEELSSEIRHFGPDPHLLQALADTYLRDGSYRYAEKWYRKALSLSPEHAESLKNLILLSDFIEIDGLESFYQQYLQLHPRDASINRRYIRYLFQLEKYAKTIERIETILPFIDDTHWFNRIMAISYRRTGEFSRAAVIYRQLLRQEPEKEEYLKPLVYCLRRSGDNDQAVRILAAAIDHLPEPSAELFLIFGVIQFKRGNLNAALRAFRDAQDRAPGDWRPYHNIGEVYKKRGMQDYAGRFFLRAEKLKASDAVG